MSENLNLRKAEASIAGIIEERSFRKTVAHHDEIRREMLAGLVQERDFDEIDELVAMPDPPSKRSDRETSRVLSILDSLERGNG
jgi:hypothetical protein